MTVSEFYDMVLLNMNHRLRIKEMETDVILDNIESVKSLENSKYKNKEIKHLSTDFVNRIYVLWI